MVKDQELDTSNGDDLDKIILALENSEEVEYVKANRIREYDLRKVQFLTIYKNGKPEMYIISKR